MGLLISLGFAALLSMVVIAGRTLLAAVSDGLVAQWRRMTPFGRVAASLAVGACVLYGGGKTRSAKGTPDRDVVRAANWNIRGAWEDSFDFDFAAGWVFPSGTNRLAGIEVFSQGYIRPPRNQQPTTGNQQPLADLGARVSIIPGVSAFSYEFTPSNSYRFTWNDVPIGRQEANNQQPTTNNIFSIDLFRSGDTLVVSNGVAAYRERVLPFDWDRDGILNEKDARPYIHDGDHFGNDNSLPEGANSNNYCWVEVIVADAAARVTFAGDGPSDYPDPDFVAMPGVAYRVALLIGKTYVVSSDESVSIVERSSDEITVTSGADGLTIVWPVTYEIESFARSFSRNIRMLPPGLSGTFSWSTNACCAWVSDGSSSVPECNDGCTCGGCTLGSFTFHYEGYRLTFAGIACGCVDGPDEELTPTVSFSATPAVVFKDKSASSFESSYLTCRATVDRPGTFTLTQTGDQCTVRDLNDMRCFDGYTWTVDSPQTCEYIFVVTRAEKSSSLEGTVFNVNFTAEDGSEVMDSSARVVFSEYETQTVATWPIDRSRRTIGVCEKVHVVFNPQPLGMKLSVSSSGGVIENTGNGRWTYTAPDHACEDVVNSSLCGSLFCLSVVKPVGYESRLHSIEYDERTGVSGSFRVCMDLVLMPTNVSFSAIDVIEIGERASRFSGYFSELRNAHHLEHSTAAGANVWVSVGMGNKCCDYVTMAELLPPWIGGGLLWPIPNKYRRSGSADAGRFFCNTDQRFSVDFLGTSSCDKFGWHVSVTTNRNVTFSKGTNQ